MIKNQNPKSGFTIIEVTLVLGIAGLIFMMVFFVLPVLQRNQRDAQRKNDAAIILSSVRQWKTNNRNTSLKKAKGSHSVGSWGEWFKVVPDSPIGRYLGAKDTEVIGEYHFTEISNLIKDITIAPYGPYNSNYSIGFDPGVGNSVFVIEGLECSGFRFRVEQAITAYDLATGEPSEFKDRYELSYTLPVQPGKTALVLGLEGSPYYCLDV